MKFDGEGIQNYGARGGIICWRFYEQSLIKQQGWHFPRVTWGGETLFPFRKSTGGDLNPLRPEGGGFLF